MADFGERVTELFVINPIRLLSSVCHPKTECQTNLTALPLIGLIRWARSSCNCLQFPTNDYPTTVSLHDTIREGRTSQSTPRCKSDSNLCLVSPRTRNLLEIEDGPSLTGNLVVSVEIF